MISKEVAELLFSSEVDRVEVDDASRLNRAIIYGYQPTTRRERLIGAFVESDLSCRIKIEFWRAGFNVKEEADSFTVIDKEGDSHVFSSSDEPFSFERLSTAADKFITLLQRP